jgi:hypothetical protein
VCVDRVVFVDSSVAQRPQRSGLLMKSRRDMRHRRKSRKDFYAGSEALVPVFGWKGGDAYRGHKGLIDCSGRPGTIPGTSVLPNDKTICKRGVNAN